ncbi:GspH/FimT family pseudopilin [Alkalisalibacterium limincola]|uniref:Type II secretion system protein H n=1 Tax=Alkalisalibacterium limincola TaxID=2699169 RepID=A0A5C8KSM6_9GAMM|nr:GspH/FimT family pseudopilin [Alkalisalibacterium limincola]TXK62598.1 prepilin-type N-terminal cleavage/methylation domain-containing protein [Alkalisalibacterium limincola]
MSAGANRRKCNSLRACTRAGGFTLIELLITVAVLAVVLAIAAPSFRGMVNGNRITAAANEFVGLLQSAKMESIRRNGRVTVCPSTNGTSCGGANWRRVIVLAPDGVTVLRDQTVSADVLVSVSGSISGASANTIVFRSDGLAREGTTRTILTGKVRVCMDTTRPVLNARHISVSGARVSVDPALTSASCTTTVPNA